MFAVTTQNVEDPSVLTLMLLNGVTGSIIHQSNINNVSPNHAYSTVFTENFFAATFQRRNSITGLSQQELTVVELFAQKQEDDTKRLLMEYLGGDKKFLATQYSSVHLENQPLYIMETYILPQSVKSIGISETQHHITGRALVGITTDNKVYTIRDTFFSARRPYPPVEKDFMTQLKEDLEDADKVKPIKLKSELFPRYEPIIPQQNRKFISYDLELFGLEQVRTFTTRLESTSQVLVFGHDLFFARMMPDKGFDLLDEDFNYYALFAFIVLLIIGDYALSIFLKKRSLVKTFLTH